VRAGRAKPESAFRRLVSLRAETHRPRLPERLRTGEHAHRFAFSPPVSRVSAGLRASFRLVPVPPRGLATSRQQRHATCPIDFCHPYELRAPAPRAFPAHYRSFHCVGAPRSLGSARLDRGTGCFTTSEPLWRIANGGFRPEMAFRPGLGRGHFLPTAPLRSSLWHPCRLVLFRLPPSGLRRWASPAFADDGGRENAAKITVTAAS